MVGRRMVPSWILLLSMSVVLWQRNPTFKIGGHHCYEDEGETHSIVVVVLSYIPSGATTIRYKKSIFVWYPSKTRLFVQYILTSTLTVCFYHFLSKFFE